MINWSGMNDDGEEIASSGKIEIGLIRQSASGRWRWEIISLPGLFRFRDEAHGWEDDKLDAKLKVHELWNRWLYRAGLRDV